MNIKYIINILLILFILHIILINVNIQIKIGEKKNEYFENNKEKTQDISKTDNQNSKDDEFRKKLLKYIQAENIIHKEENEFNKLNNSDIAPHNVYTDENNVPNFESNVADIKQFYNINYDNLSENELKDSVSNCPVDAPLNNNLTPQNCVQPLVRKSTELPVTWEYNNELPMNGGSMNGIFGYDGLESQFSSFASQVMDLQPASDNNFQNIPHNDLRKPIVYSD